MKLFWIPLALIWVVVFAIMIGDKPPWTIGLLLFLLALWCTIIAAYVERRVKPKVEKARERFYRDLERARRGEYGELRSGTVGCVEGRSPPSPENRKESQDG